ncbi:MAG: hypothetical protein ACLRSX_04335 [Akkermansia sp.]|jgi:hypothetical protein|nr:hypothetical protein [Akkermansia sp. GGCC_0220]
MNPQERVAAPHAPTWGRLWNAELPSINQFLAGILYAIAGNTRTNLHEI